MASPFPGMDPYLEDAAHWPAFHQELVAVLYQTVLPSLADRYRARIGNRCYVSEMPLFTSILQENHAEEYIEICSRVDGRVVTLIDVVSPANKTIATGRHTYLATREQAIQQRAAIVELDLLTQGQPTLDFNREGLPEHHFSVTVTRGTAPDRYEIYTATVQKRLPKFKLPLAADDRDTVIDLQLAVIRAYEQGGFAQTIDYTAPLPRDVVFDEETRHWIADRLAE